MEIQKQEVNPKFATRTMEIANHRKHAQPCWFTTPSIAEKLGHEIWTTHAFAAREVSNIIVSSPEMAKEVMKIHDAVFASRPTLLAVKIITYDCKGISFLHWIGGLRHKLEKVHEEADRILESDQLDLPLTDSSIKAVLLDIFTAGSETSSTLVEWAMSEMLKTQG
ncbi:hypothetical protein FNV43_RR01385 [Rhamnella rubrinervis]|uniref:Cytochrome P450 n=1 Tax=Rhamnella rubrinervis TaxID=2594499 RepID=A0A8K0HQB2_9ROSA|nr:hypothetical protein FNV43_RR01385 [Rhamnella rubrinervis]